jgi:hypothetical protein
MRAAGASVNFMEADAGVAGGSTVATRHAISECRMRSGVCWSHPYAISSSTLRGECGIHVKKSLPLRSLLRPLVIPPPPRSSHPRIVHAPSPRCVMLPLLMCTDVSRAVRHHRLPCWDSCDLAPSSSTSDLRMAATSRSSVRTMLGSSSHASTAANKLCPCCGSARSNCG